MSEKSDLSILVVQVTLDDLDGRARCGASYASSASWYDPHAVCDVPNRRLCEELNDWQH